MSLIASIGTTVRKSPFFDSALADGLRSVSVYNQMYIPVHYGDPQAEYERLMNGVVMWDVGCERQVQIEGPYAGRLAQYLTPRYIGNMPVGQGYYVPLCDHDGWIINDPVLLKLSENCFWLSIADSEIHLWASAIARERGWDVSVSEPDVSPLAVQGPKSFDVIADLFGEDTRKMRYFAFIETDLDGIPLVLARSGYSKQGGFELYLRDGKRGADLWQAIKTAGAPYGIGPGAPTLPERVESALLSYGGDMRRQNLAVNPYEVGFGPLIDLTKGHDFVGRAALQAIANEGPKRRRVGFFVDGRPEPLDQAADIILEGEKVGYVTIMCFSPQLDRTIATGMIPTTLSAGASGLAVDLPSGQHKLEITELPFVRNTRE